MKTLHHEQHRPGRLIVVDDQAPARAGQFVAVRAEPDDSLTVRVVSFDDLADEEVVVGQVVGRGAWFLDSSREAVR